MDAKLIVFNTNRRPCLVLQNILKSIINRCPALIPALLAGCLEVYEPDLDFLTQDTLVVDALLDATGHSATVKLSGIQPLYDESPPPPVTEATVSIVAGSGARFTLTEGPPGTYTLAGIPVVIEEKYTLNITTRDGRELYSDPMSALATPPIESITFATAIDKTSMDILVNARDPSGKANYFTWDFVETYEYTAPFFSGFTFNNKIPRLRQPADEIYRCWRTIPSSAIGIVTTKDLSASVINEMPLVNIPGGSLKFSNRYSILVTQRVVSAEEYFYLRQLKKTTEGLGGLFAPTPTPVQGNIHDKDDPQTVVLGYFSASGVERKRTFITYNELPEFMQIPQGQGSCQIEYTCDARDTSSSLRNCVFLDIISDNYNLLFALYDSFGFAYSYAFVQKECSDCREHGGVTKRPDFW